LQLPGTSWFFTISERTTPDSITLAAAGRVGSAAAPQLAAALMAAGRQTSRVVLDVSEVDYISSAGIQAIEQAADRLRAEGKTLTTCGASGATRLCLETAGVTPV